MREAWIGCANRWWQQIDDAIVRKREDEGIGGLFPASIEYCGFERAVFKTQASDRRTQNDFAAFFFDGGSAAVVEVRQRDRRNAHAVAGPVGEKCLPKNVDAKAGLGAVEFFLEGTDHAHSPEPPHRRG